MISNKANGHWKYDEEINIEGKKGFVYIIIDTEFNFAYIGKKNFWSKRAGRLSESNWKTYTSSSKILNDELKKRGKSKFKFVILDIYKSASGLNYAEVWSIITSGALEKPSFLNGEVERLRSRVKEVPTERHKRLLNKYVKSLGI